MRFFCCWRVLVKHKSLIITAFVIVDVTLCCAQPVLDDSSCSSANTTTWSRVDTSVLPGPAKTHHNIVSSAVHSDGQFPLFSPPSKKSSTVPIRTVLTKTCKQYVHRMPISIVPTVPTRSPELQKALGIARIPVPKLPLSKWMSVSEFLQTATDKIKHN